MISTKSSGGRRTVHGSARTPSLHDAKLLYRSKERDMEPSLSTPFVNEKPSSKGLRVESRSLLHRHSEGTFINSTFGKLPLWMTKPGYENYRRYRSIPNFLAGEQYGYSNNVYHSAALIFERLAIRKDIGTSLIQYTKDVDTRPLQFDSPRFKRQAFELAYQALKYQDLLEEILLNSGFLFAHPMADDQMALVMVMLYDFQNRKWSGRCQVIGEDVDQELSFVGNALYDHKIRLAAALAKCRVKNQALSIDYILPETVRQQEKCASKLPQSTWVNTIKSSVDKVAKHLIELGYSELCGKQENLLPLKGKYFFRDSHCDDVLLFPWDQKEALKALDLVKEGQLVLQDKTSSVAVQAMASLLTEDDECDIIHTDVASGLTTAHLAITLHNATKKQVEMRDKMYSNPLLKSHVLSNPEQDDQALEVKKPTLYACGVRDEIHRAQLEDLFKTLGITNVKLVSERFVDLQPDGDPRFERVKLILCTPQCTRTAVSNPIEFMLMEGDQDTYDILRDLSHGRHNDHAKEAGQRHLSTLKVALKFNTIQACVYVVRSVHEAENENVVNSAIKWHKHHAAGSMPFRVCPPTVPLMAKDLKDNVKSRSTKFLYLRQSPTMNGCFLAVLSREIGSDEMTVKDIIRRAALKGLVKPIHVPEAKPVQVTETKPKLVATKTAGHHDHEEPDGEKRVPLKKKTSSTTRTIHAVRKSGKAHQTPPSPSKSSRAVRETKSPSAADVDRLLGLYNSKHSESKVHETPSEVPHVNISLEFHEPSSLRFSQNDLVMQTSPRIGAVFHTVSSQGGSSSLKVSPNMVTNK